MLGATSAFAAEQTQGSTVTVGEVVVTAERRTQSIQKSSLAISVLTPDALKQAGVTQTRDLVKLDPGVQIGQGGPATQIYIRGIGDFGSTPLTNPAVATNVDGVYVSRSQSIEGNFFDLERIEVLKGPQGTLYGRNATGGVLNIISRKPQLGQFGGTASVELGDYSLVQAEGALNVPIGEDFALRGAFQSVSRDGYTTSGFDDDHHQSYRLSGLWKPTDALSVQLIGEYTQVGGVGPGQVFKGPLQPLVQAGVTALGVSYPTNPRADFFDPEYRRIYNAVAASQVPQACVSNASLLLGRNANGVVTTPIGEQGFCGAGSSTILPSTVPGIATFTPHVHNKFTNFTAEVNYNLGFATLTVLPAYRKVRNDYLTFPGGVFNSASHSPEKSDTRSLEVRLGNTSRALTWVLGAYLFDEKQNAVTGGIPSYNIRNGNVDTFYLFRNQSEAVFGQASYSVTDQLRVIAGVRFTRDHRAVNGQVIEWAYLGGDPYLPPGTAPNAGLCYLKPDPCVRDVFVGKRTFSATTGKVGLEYDLAPQNMLYATFATGQKAGGFNATSVLGGAPNQASSYNPEKLKALELGSRNRFMEGRLQVNLEGFYWKYRDSQQNFNFLAASGLPTNGYQNAGRATMYGADVDITARVTDNDLVHAGVEYNHARFDSFVYTAVNVTSNNTGCIISPQLALPIRGINFQQVDCSGRPLIRTPRWSGSVSYVHTFDMPNGGTLDAGVSALFATVRWGGVSYLNAMRLPSYVTEDVHVTYHNPDKKWSVDAYVRNLTDRLVYTGTDSSPNYGGMVVANVSSPRTIGVRFDTSF